MKTETQATHTPEHVDNPSYPCSCFIRHTGIVSKIHYCAMHSTAPEMKNILSAFLAAYYTWNSRADGGEDNLHTVAKLARAAIAKAEGEAA